MTRVVHITTGARIHFGLICGDARPQRNFGGAGLMVDFPGHRVTLRRADRFTCAGPGETCARVERWLAEKLSRTAFTDEDRAFIAGQAMFFLATADADGWPECSYKGGVPGFVRVLDAQTLAFPSYDGNGMFRSLGNVQINPRVGLLFIDFEQPRRLRVLGRATLSFDAAELAALLTGADPDGYSGSVRQADR